MTERRDPSSVNLRPGALAGLRRSRRRGAGPARAIGRAARPAYPRCLAGVARRARDRRRGGHRRGPRVRGARPRGARGVARASAEARPSCRSRGGDLCAAPVGRERRRAPRADRGRDRGGERAPRPAGGFALRGVAAGGDRVVALVTPLYLRFVRVLWCRYLPEDGITWARHDPIVRAEDARAGDPARRRAARGHADQAGHRGAVPCRPGAAAQGRRAPALAAASAPISSTRTWRGSAAMRSLAPVCTPLLLLAMRLRRGGDAVREPRRGRRSPRRPRRPARCGASRTRPSTAASSRPGRSRAGSA